METFIIHIKNEKEKEVLTAFLNSLKIDFHTEEDEEITLIKAYDKAKAKKEKPVPFDADEFKKCESIKMYARNAGKIRPSQCNLFIIS